MTDPANSDPTPPRDDQGAPPPATNDPFVPPAGEPAAPTPTPSPDATPTSTPAAPAADPSLAPAADVYAAPAGPAYAPPVGDPYAIPPADVYARATPPYTGGATAAKAPVLSIISMILGIVGVLGGLFIFWFPIVGPILQLWLPAAAVVLGFLGRRREPSGKGFWLTGIITGFVGLGLFLIGLIITIAFFAAIGSSPSYY
ncbi:MAG: hypothetical protein ABWZ77_00070 [Naasia sp.]